MVKIIPIVLTASILVATSGLAYAGAATVAAPATKDFTSGIISGKTIAADFSDRGWFWGSYAASLGLGFIGAGGAVAASQFTSSEPSVIVLSTNTNGKTPEYLQGFTSGYAEVVKSKKLKASLYGSAWGIGTNIVLGLAVGAIIYGGYTSNVSNYAYSN